MRAGPGRNAVHPRNDGEGERGQLADERVVISLHRMAEMDAFARRHRPVVQILPSAETTSRAGDDLHPRVAQLAERVRHLPVNPQDEAVEPLRATACEEGGAIFLNEVEG